MPLEPPEKGTTSERTRKQAKREVRAARSGTTPKVSSRRSRARIEALKREPRAAASHRALSRQAHRVAARKATRTRADRRS